MSRLVLTLSCDDRMGIVAAVPNAWRETAVLFDQCHHMADHDGWRTRQM